MTLYEATRALFLRTHLTRAKIAADTGLSLRWLAMIASDDDWDPGIKRIQRLHDYLEEAERGQQPQPPEAIESSAAGA